MPAKTNPYIVPLSIIVAGLIIGAAVYLTNRPQSTPLPAGTNTAQTTTQSDTKIAIAAVDPAKDHILGNPNAPIQFIEYSDAQCPFCRSFEPTMEQVVATFGKTGQVARVYREFPLASLHPDATRRANALECAAGLGGNDKFWAFESLLYGISDTDNEGTPDLGAMAAQAGLDKTKFNSCLTTTAFAQVVNDQEADAVAGGGKGTPFNVLVMANGVTQAAKDAVTTIQGKYGPDVVYVSDDGKKIAIGGALPQNDVMTILNAQLK